MTLDIILLIVGAVVTVGFTVLGVYLATEHPTARKVFVIAGALLLLVSITQGVRQLFSQAASDEAFMNIQRQMHDAQRQYDTKIDGLFALLQPRVTQNISSVKRVIPAIPKSAPLRSQTPPPSGSPPQSLQAHLSVSQSSLISTRPDAPVATKVVVQTDRDFPALRFVMQCDKPLVDAEYALGGGSGMVQMMVSSGLAKGHPNIYVYSYGSSTPPFGPANPLIIEVWSKEPVTCNQVATF